MISKIPKLIRKNCTPSKTVTVYALGFNQRPSILKFNGCSYMLPNHKLQVPPIINIIK